MRSPPPSPRSKRPKVARSTDARIALTVAGLDPSGGAGIAADLRGFAAAGAWGCAVASVLTVQSTAGLVSAHPVAPSLLRAQLVEVLAHHPVGIVKTGALGNAANVRVLLDVLAAHPRLRLVVDPVLMPTRGRGAALLDDASDALRSLVARAVLVTPNAREATVLTGIEVTDVASQERAGRALLELGARAVLVKGGHVRGRRAVDVLITRRSVVRLSARRLDVGETHGTGCTLASMIAGRLASTRGADDASLVVAVRWAKRRLSRALGGAMRVGDGLLVLSP